MDLDQHTLPSATTVVTQMSGHLLLERACMDEEMLQTLLTINQCSYAPLTAHNILLRALLHFEIRKCTSKILVEIVTNIIFQ